MNHGKTFLFAAILSYPLCLWSQDSSVTAELSLGSKYVDRAIQYGDITLHPSLEWGQGDFYAGLWTALPLENTGGPDFFEEEYDFYAGRGWALSDKAALDVGATYYVYEDSDEVFETYVGVSSELGTLSPSFYAYYDFDAEALTLEASSGFALPLQRFPVEATIYLGRVEARGAGDYTYCGADLIYPVELSAGSRLAFGLHYADNDIGFGVPDGHLYGSVGVTLGF